MSAQGVSWAQRVAQRRNILALSLAWSYSLERKRGSNKKSSYLAYRIKRLFIALVCTRCSKCMCGLASLEHVHELTHITEIEPHYRFLVSHLLTLFHLPFWRNMHWLQAFTILCALRFHFAFFSFFFPLRGTDVPLISGVSLASNARGLN